MLSLPTRTNFLKNREAWNIGRPDRLKRIKDRLQDSPVTFAQALHDVD